MREIRCSIKALLDFTSISNENLKNDIMSLSDSLDVDILLSNLKQHVDNFNDEGINIEHYVSMNYDHGKYNGQLDDYGLAAAHSIVKKKMINSKKLQYMFDSFDPFILKGDLMNIVTLLYSKSESINIEELKLGYERGIDIKEIAFLLGNDNRDTHDNLIIFDRYKEFFRDKTKSNSIQDVKAFITSVKLGTNMSQFKGSDLILYAKTMDDISKNAPVVKTNPEFAIQIENMYKGKNRAYYYQDGDTFVCKSLRDGQELATKDEGLAMSWVCKKNYQSIPVTRQIKRGK